MTKIDRRREYASGELDESSTADDPFTQFDAWMQRALEDDRIDEAYAMNIATVAPDGRPTNRVVLLRGYDDDGFVFYTNYDSDKGKHLAANPRIAATFYWGPLEEQIRIEGVAERVPEAESDEYFASRPHKSKLGALVSSQSSIIPGRDVLESEMDALSARYPEGSDIPRPAHWGGYRIKADLVEFWHGRRSRLHDRVRYRLTDDTWHKERLAP